MCPCVCVALSASFQLASLSPSVFKKKKQKKLTLYAPLLCMSVPQTANRCPSPHANSKRALHWPPALFPAARDGDSEPGQREQEPSHDRLCCRRLISNEVTLHFTRHLIRKIFTLLQTRNVPFYLYTHFKHAVSADLTDHASRFNFYIPALIFIDLTCVSPVSFVSINCRLFGLHHCCCQKYIHRQKQTIGSL